MRMGRNQGPRLERLNFGPAFSIVGQASGLPVRLAPQGFGPLGCGVFRPSNCLHVSSNTERPGTRELRSRRLRKPADRRSAPQTVVESTMHFAFKKAIHRRAGEP
jgi:hypothetical protein